ncbi:MAG TPA: grasp-with-spasm system ATP-grasp peptide maturase [Cytophagales bacterium]|nr:grasp-with-spasm system ATP-grasp peptide maturase [Cytophagales bacterium]HAA23280.1 grasp-with-spasm system ATP-grasp peptide maturase [Cytophagales bacterium]HAP61850.1 grasp-with-spasm system ATP-grasp peptide maturase [Cytophagales bacterium]
MILIFSNTEDFSTHRVMQWLKRAGKRVLRLNYDEPCQFEFDFPSDSHGPTLRVKSVGSPWIDLQDLSAVWYRRVRRVWNVDDETYTQFQAIQTRYYGHSLTDYLEAEWRVAYDYLLRQASQCGRALGHPQNGQLNKLVQLVAAKSVGISIPISRVTTDANQLMLAEDTITKPLSDPTEFTVADHSFRTYTAKIDAHWLERVPKVLFPSYVQEAVPKEVELRIYYLDGRCYSMAIFSQQNEQTAIDFRQYNSVVPNRMEPYQLPSEVEEKIGLLMGQLELNQGALDFILTPAGEYVFLEVNPTGSFGMISSNCHFPIEHDIAEWLMQSGN